MIFTGSLLWAPSKALTPSWTRGTWRIDNGVIDRIEERPGELGGYAIPGFVDSHAHIGIGEHGGLGPAQQLEQALAQRSTGVLAIRDCGSPVDTRWIDSRADLPKLKRAGRHLARPKRYIRGLPIELEDVKDLPEALAEQARHSDGWVKLVGDWIDRSKGADSDLEPLWPQEVLLDAVAAAHEAGARVAVHSFAHSTIDDLLTAGVDDIEHATGMDADQADEAARRGVLVTPTLLQVGLFNEFAAQAGSKYPVYAETMMKMFERRREHFAMLREAGVTLLMGTDSGGYQEHGSIGKEFALWQAQGVDRTELLDIASWHTRRHLGFEALHPGASADLLIYLEDPRTGGDLNAPDAVILGGKLIAPCE